MKQILLSVFTVTVFLFSLSLFAETRTPVLTNDSITAHSGDLLQKETDLKIPGRGLDYEFTRVYRSRITYEEPLGENWDLNRIIQQYQVVIGRLAHRGARGDPPCKAC